MPFSLKKIGVSRFISLGPKVNSVQLFFLLFAYSLPEMCCVIGTVTSDNQLASCFGKVEASEERRGKD